MAQDIALRSPGSSFDIALSAGGTSVNADATGAAIAGQAGTVTVTAVANVSTTLTGAAIAGQAGTVTATGAANTTATGAAIAAQAGTVTVTGVANATPSGAASAAEAGTASAVTPDVTVTITGAAITAAAGTATSTATSNVSTTPSGAEIAAQAGTATSMATSNVSFSITGAASLAAAGTVSVTAGGNIDVNATGAEIAAQAQVTTQTGHANTNTTGAAIAAQAGTATGEGSVAAAPSQRQIGPWGLVAAYPAFGLRSAQFTITGAGIQASAGTVGVFTSDDSNINLGPHGLVSKARSFNKTAPQQDVFVNITGAQIVGEFNYPDSASSITYVDSPEVLTQAGELNEPSLVGAVALAEAGTVVASVGRIVAPVGASIVAAAGQVSAGSQPGVNADSAQIAGQAGTVTVEHGAAVSISGAQINVQASEGGLDTDTVVSVTIAGAAILLEAADPALAGPHVSVNIDGAQINGEAGLQEQQPSRGGRYRRHRGKRYVVEIGNELFDVRSPEHAQELLAQVRDLAEDAAERDVQSDRPSVPKVRIRTAAGKESTSNAVRLAALEAQKAVNAAYAKQVERRKIDREISMLMLAMMEREAREQDEEDAIIALLLF